MNKPVYSSNTFVQICLKVKKTKRATQISNMKIPNTKHSNIWDEHQKFKHFRRTLGIYVKTTRPSPRFRLVYIIRLKVNKCSAVSTAFQKGFTLGINFKKLAYYGTNT